MLKHFFSLILLFIAANQISALSTPITMESTKSRFSSKQKILISGTLGVSLTAGAIIAGPAVLPVATVAAIKTVAATVIAKAAAATIAIKTTTVTTASAMATPAGIQKLILIARWVSNAEITCQAIHYLRQYVYPTTEQEIAQLEKEVAAMEKKLFKNI